jgi:tungstate transport system ATP-binding protein
MKILPLKINNLNYSVNGNNILKNINIVCEEPGITIIAGNNGSGKSTLLKLLHGLIDTEEEKITWNNDNNIKIKKYQSMVFQNPILLNRTVRENLEYIMKSNNKDRKNSAEEVIDKLNIENIAHISAKYISGGERQKVAIAMAIIRDPKIIFLDEPTSQLDPVYKNEIEHIISSLSNDGVKIFMTTHDISQIKRIGKEIIFIEKGKVLFQNKVKYFFNGKHCELIEKYINYG